MFYDPPCKYDGPIVDPGMHTLYQNNGLGLLRVCILMVFSISEEMMRQVQIFNFGAISPAEADSSLHQGGKQGKYLGEWGEKVRVS